MFDDRFRALTRGRALILGHRGSPQRARENSLESFQLALQAGADGIEVDVRCTCDGVLVAHHDDTLPSGERIADLTYSRLKPLAKKTGYDLPTLAEVFRLLAKRGLLNIELKPSGIEAEVVTLATDLLPAESFAFSSFDTGVVAACRRLAPDVPSFLIVYGPRDLERDLTSLRQIDASGIAIERSSLTEAAAHFFRELHYPIFAWVVDDPAEALQLAEWGVTGLITDTPESLVPHFDERWPRS